MDTVICERCGKEITTIPCPHCPKPEIIAIDVSDTLSVGDEVTGVVVEGPSEVIIEREGHAHGYTFKSGLPSGDIVNTSLMQENLSDVIPPYIQTTMISNIEQIEQFIRDSKGKETVHEHSFEINLGIFKWKYKRTVKGG